MSTRTAERNNPTEVVKSVAVICSKVTLGFTDCPVRVYTVLTRTVSYCNRRPRNASITYYLNTPTLSLQLHKELETQLLLNVVVDFHRCPSYLNCERIEV
jgi:hypothetical protein